MTKLFFSISVVLFIAAATFAQKSRIDEKVETRKIAQTDRPLKITENPKPKYPVDESGLICVTGDVRVRVQFLASGKIGEVKAVSTLGYGLTESAVEAAKNIKFEPEIKDGNAVTITKVVVINFTIY